MNRSNFAFVTHVCRPGNPLDRGAFLSTYEMNGSLWVVFFQDGATKRMSEKQFESEGWWRTNDNGRTWYNVKGEIVA